MALGLGSRGQMITPGALAAPAPVPFRIGGSPGAPFQQPLVINQCDDTRKTCQHVTVPHGRNTALLAFAVSFSYNLSSCR